MIPPPRRRPGLSPRRFAWLFGGLLLLITVYQLAQNRTQRFEPPPSSTSAEIGAEQPVPMPNALPPQPDEEEKVYTYVEQMPQPPGGMAGLMDYLARNLRLPAEARRSLPEGKVFVRFVVRSDGHLTDVEVVKGLGRGLDEEAVRVIQQMPAWTPGKQNGRAVSVQFTVPVAFEATEPAR